MMPGLMLLMFNDSLKRFELNPLPPLSSSLRSLSGGRPQPPGDSPPETGILWRLTRPAR